jgi:hypothetical protein
LAVKSTGSIGSAEEGGVNLANENRSQVLKIIWNCLFFDVIDTSESRHFDANLAKHCCSSFSEIMKSSDLALLS